jgi:2-amino-4-hydroxy-6-hydroxymethyldihydropteridine diphosphokinase
VGVRDQPWFLNAVAEAETALPPQAVLGAAKRVERAVGRAPGPRWGPRAVDVDLLLYDDWQVNDADPWLVIPHPELWRRAFVLVPLRDLRPDLRAPEGAPIGDHLAALLAAEPAAVRRWRATAPESGTPGDSPRD